MVVLYQSCPRDDNIDTKETHELHTLLFDTISVFPSLGGPYNSPLSYQESSVQGSDVSAAALSLYFSLAAVAAFS